MAAALAWEEGALCRRGRTSPVGEALRSGPGVGASCWGCRAAEGLEAGALGKGVGGGAVWGLRLGYKPLGFYLCAPGGL